MVPPLGTAFVAWWSDDRVDQWLAKLEQPLSDDEVAEYHGLLATIRERGYSVDLSDLEVQLQVFLEAIARSHEDGLRAAAAELANRIAHLQAYNFREFADGDTYHVAAMSVPVFGTDGTVAATITALVEERVTGERIRTIGTRLLELAAGVDEQLGVTPPATGTTDGTSRRSPASRRSR
jgi:DNA-binding IclR family transcriptional regulator